MQISRFVWPNNAMFGQQCFAVLASPFQLPQDVVNLRTHQAASRADRIALNQVP
jgi:hypothetical protein